MICMITRPDLHLRFRAGLLRVVTAFGLALPALVHAQATTGVTSGATARRDAPDDVVIPQAVVPETPAGRVGQRQTRAAAAEAIGITPMARIDSRIQNRVQSRVRNRIDESYDPRANANAPFNVANDQIKIAPSGQRR